ncbi:MAG: hypothetical protein ABI318_07350, partial [Chthoniobacteraceae bacterium]
MAQQTPRPNRDQEPSGGSNPEPNFNWRGLLLFAAAILLIGGGFYLRSPNANSKTLTYPQFREALGKGLIMKEKLAIVSEPGSATDMIRGYYQTSKDAKPEPFRTQVNPNYNKYIEDELAAHGIVPDMESGSNNLFVSAMLNFLPVAFILLLLYFFFRQQLRMAGKGAMSFGKSKAKMMARDKNKVTFKDVAGVEEAKEE